MSTDCSWRVSSTPKSTPQPFQGHELGDSNSCSAGASLDRRSGKLIESKMKVLYEQMPVIYIYAINTTAGKDPKLYECPIYRKPQRTDLKYVGSIDFETEFNPKHWTLRGVALLCDIK